MKIKDRVKKAWNGKTKERVNVEFYKELQNIEATVFYILILLQALILLFHSDRFTKIFILMLIPLAMIHASVAIFLSYQETRENLPNMEYNSSYLKKNVLKISLILLLAVTCFIPSSYEGKLALVIVSLIMFLLFFLIPYLETPKSTPSQSKLVVASNDNEKDSDSLGTMLKRLEETLGLQKKLAEQEKNSCHQELEELSTRFKEFVGLLSKQEDESLVQRKVIYYDRTLAKICDLTGEDYWVSLVEELDHHPSWREKLEEIKAAINKASEKLLLNMRELKQKTMLEVELKIRELNNSL